MSCTTTTGVQQRRRALTDVNALQPHSGRKRPVVTSNSVSTSSTIGVPLHDSTNQCCQTSWTASVFIHLPPGGIVEECCKLQDTKRCSNTKMQDTNSGTSSESTCKMPFLERLLPASGAGLCTVYGAHYDCNSSCYQACCKCAASDAPTKLFEHIYTASELQNDMKAAVVLRYLRDHEGNVAQLSCPVGSGDVAVCSCNEQLLDSLQYATLGGTSPALPEAFRKAGEDLRNPTRR